MGLDLHKIASLLESTIKRDESLIETNSWPLSDPKVNLIEEDSPFEKKSYSAKAHYWLRDSRHVGHYAMASMNKTVRVGVLQVEEKKRSLKVDFYLPESSTQQDEITLRFQNSFEIPKNYSSISYF